jgi:hypothetical protein
MEVRAGVVRCLYCHTTNPRTGAERTGPETADRAIGCERCHGPGGPHIAAVRAGFADLAIVNPAHGTSTALTALCADCHNLNPPEAELSSPKTDPRWVRSPGISLTWSRCYTESGSSLTCLTCHDPHGKAKRPAVSYEQKCLSCHPGPSSTSPGIVCPVNSKSACLACHMPAVPNPVLHAQLTDHYIRVRARRTD